MMSQGAFDKWINALRNPSVPQIRGRMQDQVREAGGLVVTGCCALGLGYLVTNQPWYAELSPVDDEVIDLNDNEGKTFAEVADWLEAHRDDIVA